jgi:hypothetical protein
VSKRLTAPYPSSPSRTGSDSDDPGARDASERWMRSSISLESALRRLGRASLRRLLLLWLSSKTDGGKTLKQGQSTFLLVILLWQFSPPRKDLILCRNWKLFGARHPRCAGR